MVVAYENNNSTWVGRVKFTTAKLAQLNKVKYIFIYMLKKLLSIWFFMYSKSLSD